MAIIFLQQKKTQRNLILVFLAVIVITALVVWQGFLKEEQKLPFGGLLFPQKEVEIDFGVLESSSLEALESFSEIESFEGELGRENPFLPY